MSPSQLSARRSLGASLTSLGIVFLLVAGLLVMFEAPASRVAQAGPVKTADYSYTFYNLDTGATEVVADTTTENDVTMLGMSIHVSCSDEYVDGLGTKGGPSAGDPWRVTDWSITKYKDGEFDKECSGSYVPPTTTVPPTPPTITLVKSFVGSDPLPSGIDQDDFTPHIDTRVSRAWDTAITVSTGVHTIGESAPPTVPGSFAAPSIRCEGTGTASTAALVNGDAVTCTIINVYTAPDPTITLVKSFRGSDPLPRGIDQDDFTPHIDTRVSRAWDTAVTVSTGVHTIGESAPPTVPGSFAAPLIRCEGTGTASTAALVRGDAVTCTIYNVYTAPENARLTVTKTVVDTLGLGPLDVADFTLSVDGGVGTVTSGIAESVAPGTYKVSEIWDDTTYPGYTAGDWATDCASNGTVALAPGEDKTCTIINTFDPPTLTVTKTVIGGTASAADFNLQVNLVGGGSTTAVLGIPTDYAPGTYTVSETQRFGYSVSGGWVGSCSNEGETTTGANPTSAAFTMAGGGVYTCTVTNEDPLPRLRLVKDVIGAGSPDDFNLRVIGQATTAVLSGVFNSFESGTYTAAETNLSGYSAGDWSGACEDDGEVVLPVVTEGMARSDYFLTCFITNIATTTTTTTQPGGSTTTPTTTPFSTTTTTDPGATTTTLVLGADLPNTGAGDLLAILLGGLGLVLLGVGLVLLAPRRYPRWVV